MTGRRADNITGDKLCGFSLLDTGPRTRLAYENRYLNPQGHKIFADSALSAVQFQVNGSYVIPLADAARQSLTCSTDLPAKLNVIASASIALRS